MKRKNLFVPLIRLVAIVIIAMQSANANASSNAGIEIDFGKFHLNVYYSDALDYYNEADEVIRDPQSTLFTLASFIQSNSEDVIAINHTLQIELYTREDQLGNFLLITEDPQTQSTILQDEIVTSDISQKILKVICDRYVGACKQLATNKVNLYMCLKTSCAGQIRFGVFPSVSVNKKFGIIQPANIRIKPISVKRGQIGRYFEKLAP